MKTPRSRNGWVLVAVSLIALVATGAGIRQVYEAQKAMTLRREIGRAHV